MKVSVLKVLGLACFATLSVQGFSAAYAADMYEPNGYTSYKDGGMKDYASNYFSWSGKYVGITGGYAWGESTSSNLLGSGTGNGFNDSAASSVAVDLEGVSVSLNGGYNYQQGKYVFGLEADAGYMGFDERKTDTTLNNFSDTSYGFYGTLAGRLGYAMDRTMIFAKGGLAVAQIETRAGDTVDANDVTTHDDTYVGYVVGGGIEHAIDLQWIAKLEYQYIDFGDETSTNSQGDRFKHEHNAQNVRFGISYQF